MSDNATQMFEALLAAPIVTGFDTERTLPPEGIYTCKVRPVKASQFFTSEKMQDMGKIIFSLSCQIVAPGDTATDGQFVDFKFFLDVDEVDWGLTLAKGRNQNIAFGRFLQVIGYNSGDTVDWAAFTDATFQGILVHEPFQRKDDSQGVKAVIKDVVLD